VAMRLHKVTNIFFDFLRFSSLLKNNYGNLGKHETKQKMFIIIGVRCRCSYELFGEKGLPLLWRQ